MSAPIDSVIVVDHEHVAGPPVSHPVDAEVDLDILKVVPQKFEITDEKSANWLVRRVQDARQYSLRVKEWAEQEKRRAEREETVLLFLYGRQLEAWVRCGIEKLGGRRKSLCLPSGTLQFRHENTKLIVDDEAAVIMWARHNLPAAIKVTETVTKTPLNEHFAQTGEVPDGMHVEAARERFSIR
jgi:hypothetical protein